MRKFDFTVSFFQSRWAIVTPILERLRRWVALAPTSDEAKARLKPCPTLGELWACLKQLYPAWGDLAFSESYFRLRVFCL